ncbi:phage holin family protein [Kitasatospora indigofera]|uniref:phage holin family protein n=1 Tax=Kitasatospora indigofera TaxID=67307 RepID=UPI00368919A8
MSQQISRLARDELRLARVEMGEPGRRLGTGGGMLVGAGLHRRRTSGFKAPKQSGSARGECLRARRADDHGCKASTGPGRATGRCRSGQAWS